MRHVTDWSSWHTSYEDADSPLSQRLALVRRHIADWLDSTDGPVRVLSACAGDGRDVLGVLSARTDAARVTATLVELDPRLVERARTAVADFGMTEICLRCGDAGVSDTYVEAVPADLVLLCGIFGNVTDDDVQRLVVATPSLCRVGATVIWTRHTREPDLTPRIRGWFEAAGFAERAFTAPPDQIYSVGVHEFRGAPEPLALGRRLFRFVR